MTRKRRTATISSKNKPRRHYLSIAYKPKIPGVVSGEIRYDIRIGKPGRYVVGDLVSFHGWAARPYWSPWVDRSERFTLREVTEIQVHLKGIRMWEKASPEDGIPAQWIGFNWDSLGRLAQIDGIVPATGNELKRVLTGLHRIAPDPEGEPGQILEW